MWTPRRILLLLSGLLVFGMSYFVYALVLGSIDGLPQLPDKYLSQRDDPAPPIPQSESPTISRLKDAFGPKCPEVESAYPTKIELRDDGIVFAAGRPDIGSEPTKYVRMAPFSMAIFSKPRAPSERLPGEVSEISTLHADEVILELDRVINSEREMLTGKAKIIGMELRAVPDGNLARIDPRNGRVLITNNQRSNDPNSWMIFKTPGPVFYRTADHPEQVNANAPNIWTSSMVEIVNRENLPRPLRGSTLPSVAIPTEELLNANIIAEMALGNYTSPPTITAEGMKIYLKPPVKSNAAVNTARKGPSFGGGVREFVLENNVVMSFWSAGQSGFAGPAPKPDGKDAAPKPANTIAPLGALVLTGALPDAVTAGRTLAEQSLVRIRTLGAFRYDMEKNLAIFTSAAVADPKLPNNVEVTRLHPQGNNDYLVCQKLEIELETALSPAASRAPKSSGPNFRAIHATGGSVYLSSQSEQLQTQGTELHYENDPIKRRTRTTLVGSPLVAVRQKNRLETGSPGVRGQLVLESIEAPLGSKETNRSTVGVEGMGRIDIFDELTGAVSLSTSWKERLTQTRDRLGDKDVDLLTFQGEGSFVDPKTGFTLQAQTLQLWLDPQANRGGSAQASTAKPLRVQGVRNVKGQSSDIIIDQTDLLNIWFKDGPIPKPIDVTVSRPKPIGSPPTPSTTLVPNSVKNLPEGQLASRPTTTPNVPENTAPVVPPPGTIPPSIQPRVGPAFFEPTAKVSTEAPKALPLQLSANRIEVWVLRDSEPKTASGTAANSAPPTPAYRVERAECEGRVVARQKSNQPRSIDWAMLITGSKLHLLQGVSGSTLNVVGTEDLLAEVHFDNVHLSGPIVDIDQPNNVVAVAGRGWLRMPSSTDLSGNAVNQQSDLTIDWNDRMLFRGERRHAEFLGKVRAVQQPPEKQAGIGNRPSATWSRSYVLCHHLDVSFDQPIYFNQLKQPTAKASGAANTNTSAKIERVLCEPAPDDDRQIAGKPRAASQVFYGDETFTRSTGKYVKAQRITSRLLEIRIADDRSLITATGPGETRTLQLGSKDSQPQPGLTPTAPTTQNAAKPDDQEMKLTLVRFAGRLEIEDRKQIFQKATFRELVRVFHVPTEELNLAIEEHLVPKRSVVLQCTDTLIATSYNTPGKTEATREMVATGDARVKSDDYYGIGHVVKYDGNMVVLEGYRDGQATLYRRQSGVGQEKEYNSGNPLIYNTKTGQISGSESSGGSYTNRK